MQWLLKIILPILADWLFKLIKKEVDKVLREKQIKEQEQRATEAEIMAVLKRLEHAKTKEQKIEEASRILNGLKHS